MSFCCSVVCFKYFYVLHCFLDNFFVDVVICHLFLVVPQYVHVGFVLC
jgi:hypothetical protein